MQLRNGLSGGQLQVLAARHGNPGYDRLPGLVGELSRCQGYFTRGHFLDICVWANPRSRQHFLLNSEASIIRQTEIALALSTPEKERIGALRKLDGVNWTTASAILHFAHREPYPLLGAHGLWSLGVNAGCHCMSFDLWREYVETCRMLSHDFFVSMRDLDRALRQYFKESQPSNYDVRPSATIPTPSIRIPRRLWLSIETAEAHAMR